MYMTYDPYQRSFTWSQKSPFIFCRLDYWRITDSLYDMVGNVDIVSAIKTGPFCYNTTITQNRRGSKRARCGVITSDHKQILKSASDYYEKLYSTKSNLAQCYSFDSFFKERRTKLAVKDL